MEIVTRSRQAIADARQSVRYVGAIGSDTPVCASMIWHASMLSP